MLEDEASEHEHAAVALRGVLAQLRRPLAPAIASAGASDRVRRRQAIALGTLPHRIVQVLEQASEPHSLTEIVEAVKAPKSSCSTALNSLIAERRVARVGRSRATKYTRVKE